MTLSTRTGRRIGVRYFVGRDERGRRALITGPLRYPLLSRGYSREHIAAFRAANRADLAYKYAELTLTIEREYPLS